MKNHKVRPEHIIDLVGKVAASFNAWQLEYKHLPVNMRAEYMHYMSDMLDYLINTAYPIEKESTVITKLNLDSKSFEEALQKVNKIIKEYKPPKSPTDIHMELLDKIFGGDK